MEQRQGQFNSCYKYPVIPGYRGYFKNITLNQMYLNTHFFVCIGFVPRLRSSIGYRYTDSVKDAIKIFDRDDYLDKQEIERLRNFQKFRNSKQTFLN